MSWDKISLHWSISDELLWTAVHQLHQWKTATTLQPHYVHFGTGTVCGCIWCIMVMIRLWSVFKENMHEKRLDNLEHYPRNDNRRMIAAKLTSQHTISGSVWDWPGLPVLEASRFWDFSIVNMYKCVNVYHWICLDFMNRELRPLLHRQLIIFLEGKSKFVFYRAWDCWLSGLWDMKP